MAANWATLDLPTGVAGDMLLAALLDLGVPQRVIDEPLAALGLQSSYRLNVSSGSSAGLRGQHLSVELLEASPPHRHWADLKPQLQGATWPQALKTKVLEVFQLLADAEAHVHGVPAEQVHFHEVGAIDALVDVVGVCAALVHLNPTSISCNPPPSGRGSVRTAHGVLPVPVPAVLELARRHSIPLQQPADLPPGELTTPTGLALMAVLADRFSPPHSFVPAAIGVGLGHRELDRPNLLRICRFQSSAAETGPMPRWQPLVVQEAWIDDASGEDVAMLVTRLRQAGAVDTAVMPVQMKKGRAAHALTALVLPDQAEAVRRVWFALGSSIGLRERQQGRWLLPRRAGTLTTPWGVLRAKQVLRPDGRSTAKPEADDLQRLDLRRAAGAAAA